MSQRETPFQRSAITTEYYTSEQPNTPQVLRQEVRNRRHGPTSDHVTELVLSEVVGKGGYGIVYKGLWHKSIAAIKVGVDLTYRRVREVSQQG